VVGQVSTHLAVIIEEKDTIPNFAVVYVLKVTGLFIIALTAILPLVGVQANY
jgi:hypothetical protein